MFCTHCGTKLNDNVMFCHNCGAKLTPAATSNTQAPEKSIPLAAPPVTKNLTIARESQFICCAVSYKAIVDGKDFGKIGVGQSVNIPISAEHVNVEIRCTSIMMTSIHLKLSLKVTDENPTIRFKLRYGGPIDAKVSGAEILQSQG